MHRHFAPVGSFNCSQDTFFYCWVLQSVDYSAFIRQAFNGDKGLAGAITKLPLEKKFRLQTVKEVMLLDTCKYIHALYRLCDGADMFVLPEIGMKGAVQQTLPRARTCHSNRNISLPQGLHLTAWCLFGQVYQP